MATFTVDKADAVLDDIATNTVWVQLHIGDPGPSGTADVAENSSASPAPRKEATFGAPGNHPSETARHILNDAVVTWDDTELDEGQVITHWSGWDAVTSGDCVVVSTVDSPPTVGANGAEVAVGALSIGVHVYAL